MKGNRTRWLAAGIGGAAIATAAGFTGWQIAERPAVASVSPAADSSVPTSAPSITVNLEHVGRLRDLRVRVDGQDRTAAVRAARDRLMVPTEGLDDGVHTVDVEFRTSNLVRRRVREQWEFTVDTQAPSLSARSPVDGKISSRKAVKFTGRAEPGSTVSVSWGNGRSTSGTATEAGAYALTARLPEGRVATTVAARDAAGNATRTTTRVLVDTIAPKITLDRVSPAAVVTDTSSPRITGLVVKDNPGELTFGASVNGAKVLEVSGASALPPPDQDLIEASAVTAPLEVDGRRFSVSVGELPQGLNRIKVWAKDPAGNVASATTKVLVNSSEEFGSQDMRLGARGTDAKQLNERLKDAKVLKGATPATFGPRTQQALIRYQKRFKLPQTGAFDTRTRNAMVGRIVVTISTRTLRLIRDGRVFKQYKIAVGSSAHPTPTGSYQVIDKQVDPAWFPPDSPWAEGLGPIPAGPGNPLGTRWIGTSAPAIGIHGTYADYSIGTAASHGCMRMHIPEVEQLYEYVVLGMPVVIKS